MAAFYALTASGNNSGALCHGVFQVIVCSVAPVTQAVMCMPAVIRQLL